MLHQNPSGLKSELFYVNHASHGRDLICLIHTGTTLPDLTIQIMWRKNPMDDDLTMGCLSSAWMQSTKAFLASVGSSAD